MIPRRLCVVAALASALFAQSEKDMRMPWSRSNERFIRNWLALTDVPVSAGAVESQWTGSRPAENAAVEVPGGPTLTWRSLTAWGDAVDLSDGKGLKRDVAGYAFAIVRRAEAGKALLCTGSDESLRVWVNGTLAVDKSGPRQLTFDEDQVEVDLKAGENTLLVKVEQRSGPWTFSARVLERGAIPPRIQEIGPSFLDTSDSAVTVRTDINKERAGQDKVTVQVVAAGGALVAERTAARGDTVAFDSRKWPYGPYEFRFSTRRMNGLQYTTHTPWYKGDSLAAARQLATAASKADERTPEGATIRMLGRLVHDRFGNDLSAVSGNPWWAIHSALMEYEEIRMEAAGKAARARPYGFVRMAYQDEVDGSTQFCRAYLPGGYSKAKKWPLVLRLHGYNPANPEYVRWWSVDSRHAVADMEYAGREGVIYLEPHGRGNTTYLGLGDQDVMRTIEMAKKMFSVDEDRVYLVGESMGGWGTWNVATRHPDAFAAIAPIYGGADYHSQMKEEEISKLSAVDRFLNEKGSSWSMAEGLLHTPILVHHGDVDKAVNVDFSRWGVRLLQRWGYNVRYFEMPGYAHEELNVMPAVVDWLLQHRRTASPARVRLRSAELQNARAYWVTVDQAAKPNEFMVVDAEITAPNAVRVDSQNVLAMTLTAPVDRGLPVIVIWNGASRKMTVNNGQLRLTAPGYDRSAVEKNSKIAGPMGDVFNTPFAIVTGTISSDAGMREICARKSDALVRFWSDWQRQQPRVFKDVDVTDEEARKYSLIVIGGPEANAVARKFAGQIPVKVGAEGIAIEKRNFAGRRVQAIFPSPLNPERYMLMVASSSPEGMYFWRPDRLRGNEFDFTIEDDRMPTGMERMSATDLWVAGGWFNRRWEMEDSLAFNGDAEKRAKALALNAPKPGRAVDASALDAYAGSYEMAPGMVVKVFRTDSKLMAAPGQDPAVEMVPVNDLEFVIVEGPAKVVFEKDPAGKVVSFKVWQNGREMSGKRRAQ